MMSPLVLIPVLALFSFSSALPMQQEENQLGLQLDRINSIGDVNIGNIGEVFDVLIESGGTVKDVIEKFSNNSNLVDVNEIVEEVQELITRLNAGVSVINEEVQTYAGEALKEIITVKFQLRTSRTSLNSLAQRTVLAVDDLIDFSEAIFAGDDSKTDMKVEYVKEKMTIMKNLIKNTRTKVAEVKTIYTDVKKRMVDIETMLIQYKLDVDKILSNNTNEANKEQHVARAATYSTAGVSTTVCIFLDAFLITWGICSAINAAAVAGTILTLEGALAQLRANLESLKEVGQKALEDIEKLMKGQDKVVNYLFQEEEALENWMIALDRVEMNIRNPDRLFFRTLPVIREKYIKSLQELGQAAQNYLDQEEL